MAFLAERKEVSPGRWELIPIPIVEPAHPPASADHMPPDEVATLFRNGAAGVAIAQTHGLQTDGFYSKIDRMGRRTVWFSRRRVHRWLDEQRAIAASLR